MTSTCKENYRPSLSAKAISLLTELATPLFNRAMEAGEDTPAKAEAFEQWVSVKAIAEMISNAGSIKMHRENWEDLKRAMSTVHDLAHDADMRGASSVSACFMSGECPAADRIQALFVTLAHGNQGVR
jgi:hypothetical protein